MKWSTFDLKKRWKKKDHLKERNGKILTFAAGNHTNRVLDKKRCFNCRAILFFFGLSYKRLTPVFKCQNNDILHQSASSCSLIETSHLSLLKHPIATNTFCSFRCNCPPFIDSFSAKYQWRYACDITPNPFVR